MALAVDAELETAADHYAALLSPVVEGHLARVGAGLVEMDLLPYTEPIANPATGFPSPTRFPVPYLNYYPVNGALIVPMLGGPDDEKAQLLLQKLHPDREIVGVPSTAMAADGGGVGCITQQQPAGQPLR